MNHVTVHQITSEYPGKAYLNVESKDGHIMVWGGCWTEPVYLVQNGIHFFLYVFDNQAYADEWLEEHKGNMNKVTRIMPEED